MEGITLDDSARIRVLPADELTAAEVLQRDTDRFLETLERLREVARGVVDTAEHRASLIDHEMLRAIGQRLETANEEGNRKALLEKAQTELSEKLQERDRLQAEYESLLKVQRAQEMKIASLSIGDAQHGN